MKARSAGFPLLAVLLVLVILVAVNLLSTRVFTRIDLTENREYTLGPSTKSILGRLDDVVNVNVYFSRELPTYFATLDRQVKDLLDEYKAHGAGKVRVQFIDPADDPVVEQSMQQLGIPKLQLTRYQKERAETMNAYLGVAVQFEDQTEVIPVVQAVDRLEYDVTAAIVKVSTDQKTVGIAVSGPGQDTQLLQAALQQQYAVQPVDLSAGPVPAAVTSMVVKGDDAWTDTMLYHIDQFIMRGGRVLFLVPGVSVDLNTMQAQDRQVKLGPMLRTYGVNVQSSMVLDSQAPLVGFDVGSFFPLSVRYPWFPQIVPPALAKDNPITSEMQSLVLPWTSPLELTGADTTGGGVVQATVLARSSERSFPSRAPYNLNPQNRVALPTEGIGPQILAVALTGSFPSQWANTATVPGDTLGTPHRGPAASVETQMVVVGSANFLDPRFLQQFQSNAIFLANSVDWMTLGDELISIRSRAEVSRPLREVEEEKRSFYKTMAIFPVPVLVVLFGLVRARIRRSRRERYPAEFGVAS